MAKQHVEYDKLIERAERCAQRMRAEASDGGASILSTSRKGLSAIEQLVQQFVTAAPEFLFYLKRVFGRPWIVDKSTLSPIGADKIELRFTPKTTRVGPTDEVTLLINYHPTTAHYRMIVTYRSSDGVVLARDKKMVADPSIIWDPEMLLGPLVRGLHEPEEVDEGLITYMRFLSGIEGGISFKELKLEDIPRSRKR